MTDTEAMANEKLTEREQALLSFEASHVRHSARKEEAIRNAFGVTAARYYQLLTAVIAKPAALMHDPMTVRAIERRIQARATARGHRAFTTSPVS